MIKYTAELVIQNESNIINFETDINPIEYLWARYGMDTYIATLEEIDTKEEIHKMEE